MHSRVIVIALLACNLMLAGFRMSAQPPDEATAGNSTASPAPAVPGLQLLSELGSSDSAQDTDRLCYSLGPFETDQAVQAARAELTRLADEVRQRTTETLIELGYWVALPPFDDLAQAGAAMRELRQRGLEDLAVVDDPSGRHRVSLGYYLDERNARRRRDKVRELGFDAEIRLQRETEARYWLDYAQSRGAASAAQALAATVPVEMNRSIPCAGELAGGQPATTKPTAASGG